MSPPLFLSLVTALTLVTGLNLLIPPVIHASTIYSWVDNDGVVHFSDQPTPQATIYRFNSLPSTVSAASIASESKPEESSPPPPPPEVITPASVRLLAPVHEQTIRDNSGIISISAIANRNLNKGHRMQLLLDGQTYHQPQTNSTWRLTNIDRGSHQLQIQLLKDGKVIALSKRITVFLHRTSVFQRTLPAVKPR